MEWLGVGVVFLVIAGIAILWDTAEEKVRKASKTSKGAARVVATGEATVRGARWLRQKVIGLVLLLVGGFSIWVATGDVALILLGVVAIGYSIYLLWPGTRSYFFVL